MENLIEIDYAENGLVYIDGALVAFYDATGHELHLGNIGQPVHVCSVMQALRVVGVYASQNYQNFNESELSAGLTFH